MPRFFDVRFAAGFGTGVAFTLLALLVAAWLGLAALREEAGPPPLAPPDLPETTEPLGAAGEGLRLRTLDGASVSLDAFRGRPVVVNLWATWCAPCLEELPSLAALGEAAPGGAVVVIASDEPAETVRAFLAARGDLVGDASSVYLYDPPRRPPFEGEVIPATYIVAPDGAMVLRHVGAADWSAPSVRDFLARLGDA